MSRPAVREIGDGNANWHHQETGFGSWLWIYQGRGRTGILLPPQWHRGRLRRPPGRREGFVRNRVEPEGPARQERPHRLRAKPDEPRSNPGLFISGLNPSFSKNVDAASYAVAFISSSKNMTRPFRARPRARRG